MLLTALQNRFDAVEPVREEQGLLVARARMRGEPVMLWHLADLPASRADSSVGIAQRLQALGGFGAPPLEYHLGPAGVTWVLRDDGAVFLDDWLDAQGQAGLADAVSLLLDLAQALDGLHRERILHLHLQPACVRVRPGNRPHAVLHAHHAMPLEEAGLALHDPASADLRYTAPELSGRTSSRPDARTDLYLLGLLGYRLLAGRLPFDAGDALGWLHAHLAQEVPDPRRWRPGIPAPLASLLLALLAKSPAQRPASARAVADDLRRVADALQQAAPLPDLPLRAPQARFIPPQLLIGRDEERTHLREAFTRCRLGAQAVLLEGPSGIGKSALALAFLQEARVAGATTAQAKFDQFGSQRPYPALADLLDSLGRQLLQRPAAERPDSRLLGAEGAALAGLSPELARSLGLRTSSADLPPEQARQRLLGGLVALLELLTSDRELVLFIDDVQWSDPATLALLAAAMAERGMARLLLVLGERSDEGASVAAGAFAGTPLARVPVRRLEDAHIRHWVDSALPGGLAHPGPTLARLTQRSAGNPLFLAQLLGAMVTQGQLVPDSHGQWALDERAATWDALPDSALAAVAQRLASFDERDAALLGIAAALGTRFPVALLARCSGEPADAVQRLLDKAHHEGIVEPAADGEHWRFIHDRLQQAAYEHAPLAERTARHLRIGRALRDGQDPAWLFDACRHLNLALVLLDGAEAVDLALMNQRAAAQARASAGFAQYDVLMRAALRALPPRAALPPAQRLSLLQDAAEAAVLALDFAAADACLREAEPLAGTPLERARTDELRMQWLIAQERAQEALDLGIATLGRMGLRTSAKSATLDTLVQLLLLKMQLRKRPPARWVELPACEDPQQVQLQRLIFATVSVAHTLGSPLYAVLGFAGARLACRDGLTPWSWQAISVAGHILSGVFDDIDTGFAMGELSVRLGERFGTHRQSFNHLFYVMHWKVPLTHTLGQLRECFTQAERSGNFEMAGYAAGMFVGVTWNAMGSLLALEDAVHSARGFGERRNNVLVLDCCDTFDQLLATLRGPALAGPVQPPRRRRADEREFPHDPIFALIHDQLAVMLNVMAGHHGDDVVATGERVRRNLHRMAGNFSTPLHHWFEALLHAERLRERPSARSRRIVQGHLRKLRRWSAQCPPNHAHRVASLEAELAAVAGEQDAMQRYVTAVDLARSHGFTGDAAIIAHRWARHCARAGEPAALRDAMELAHTLYAQWGATAMVGQLEQSLPAFARPRAEAPVLPLDTATLIKASQAVSAEVEMETVAHRLLQQVMENAGARYAALVLQEPAGPRLAAQRAEVPGRLEAAGTGPLDRTDLPQDLLRSVVHAQADVVLHDACAPHPYGSCARWRGADGVSVLGVPVTAAGKTVGALYLENELAAGCFTPERATLANVLAAQAAIAIANARLFSELATAHEDLRHSNARLEERVEERTRALEDNHARLRELERQLAADEERQRIMRDLHDGLGSQLFVTLSRVERDELDRGEIGEALRACIADMRLVLEAMSPEGNDFLDAWGSFRYRWEQQLQAAGIASDWSAPAPDQPIPLPAPTALQVLRIGQEALTNVLKHARATRVDVRLARTGGGLLLEVRDDGCGPGAPGPAGRGLGNMQVRAARMGARVQVRAADPGTLVRLDLDLA